MVNKVQTIHYAAMQQSTSSIGLFSPCLPSMVYQLDGNRLIALVSLDDLLDTLSNEDDLSEQLQNAEPSVILEDWSGFEKI